MTPADSPSDPARTFREASLTTDGKKTADAPMAVAAPAPQTSPKATPTFPSATGMMVVVVIYVRILNDMLINESDDGSRDRYDLLRSAL